jgi:hypothetical protein
MIYLTFNEGVSGIFYSQVTGVVRFLNEQLNGKVKLWCFVSLRGFFHTRRCIRETIPDARVIPMFPTMKLWKLNRFTLYIFLLFSREKKIMGRSVWATWLALKAKRNKLTAKVIYDGRGAVYHESKEYNVLQDPALINEINSIERSAVNQSDFRLAVSAQLVQFWKEFYNYGSSAHVVIPCTLNSEFFENKAVKAERYFSEPDLITGVYSGSAAGWQTAGEITQLIERLFAGNKNFRLIILSPDQKGWEHVKQMHGDKVIITSVKHNEVRSVLQTADYGLLVRENSVTNKVASPVKFAEYLSAGLKVLISPELGDFSKFVQQNDCGYVLQEKTSLPELQRVSEIEKERIVLLAKNNFLKENFRSEYKKLLDV